MFTKQRDFPIPGDSAPRLSVRVRQFLTIHGYRVQDIQDEFSTLIEAKKTNILRDFTGFSSVVSVRIWHDGNSMHVLTRSERWTLRFVLVAIGLMAPPLFLIPSIGGYLQFKQIDDLWTEISGEVGRLLRPA